MTQIKYDNPAKRFLRGYRALLLRRESLLREIERMRESVTGTTVQLKQDVVSTSGAGDKIGDTVARIVDAEDALKPALDEIGREVSRIMAAIESVPDEMQKTVLTLRYIEGLDWLKISESIGYEISNTYIIHGRALVAVNRWLESRKALEGSISW
jgi:DNA-directed RNA polymerase specialized sigma24 family protein